ncbi:CD63 antigen [Austrofundulus limnaeus]|uniref:CD63 antigen n=1 Tax=Austrofundulus limnaeus TaxID=52670 RepID=A0A2I4BXE8_AUSLI|nr:PREDICTED: CD63 antigen-like [Austrofundulus limnaeus]
MRVNIWLKRSYYGVISVMAVFIILLVGLSLFVHGYLLNDEETESLMGLHFIYGFSALTLILLIFGALGARKEKMWALIVFAVGMILICLYLIAGEIAYLVLKPQLEAAMMSRYYIMLPLANATESELANLKYKQAELQCCGVENYTDWEGIIPDSCLCDEKSTNPCMNAPNENQTEVAIYAKPCLPIIIEVDMQFLHAAKGIQVGLILLWVLSIGLCVGVLCQINKKLETPTVVYSSEAKAGNYTYLTEAPDSCPT